MATRAARLLGARSSSSASASSGGGSAAASSGLMPSADAAVLSLERTLETYWKTRAGSNFVRLLKNVADGAPSVLFEIEIRGVVPFNDLNDCFSQFDYALQAIPTVRPGQGTVVIAMELNHMAPETRQQPFSVRPGFLSQQQHLATTGSGGGGVPSGKRTRFVEEEGTVLRAIARNDDDDDDQ